MDLLDKDAVLPPPPQFWGQEADEAELERQAFQVVLTRGERPRLGQEQNHFF